MKKSFLFLALIISVILSSCVEEPEFKGVSNFKLDSFNNNILKFNVDLRVDNPNKFGIKVRRSFLDVYLGDSYIGKGKLIKGVKLKRKRESNLTVPVELELEKGAMFKLMRLATSKNVKVRVEGVVRGSAMGIPKRIKVNETKDLNLKDLGINFGSLLGN